MNTNEVRVDGSPWQIHASYHSAMRSVGLLLVLLALFQFIAWVVPTTPGATDIPYYLPIHALMETFSIVVAMMVFSVGWTAHAGRTSGNLILLACLFFIIGCLDFSHTVSYGGMPDFFSANGPDKHLKFWILARLLAALALLLVVLRPWHRNVSKQHKYSLLISLIVLMGLFNWTVINYQETLPDLFIPGQGLTPLKKNLEYLCIAINLVTMLLLWSKMRTPQPFNAPLLFAASGVMAMSEFFFTLYTTMTGAYNVLGHIYKVICYLIIYRAVVVESIEQPYLQLAQAQKNMALAVEASTTGMLMVGSDGRVTLTNAHADTIFGYAPGELIGQPVGILIPEAQREAHNSMMTGFMQAPQERKMGEGRELFGRHRLGHNFRVRIGLTPISDHSGKFVLASVEDITSIVENERRIHQLIYFDPLTGLPNRNLLHDRVRDAIHAASQGKRQFAVLFLDLDHFKNINDTLGHPIGDKLLVAVGLRLKATVRETDTVARIGGDEFVIVLDHTDVHSATAMAAKLLESLAQPFSVESHLLVATPSIGIAMYPENGTEFDVLYQNADTAMYKAKADGRDGFCFFTQEMHLHGKRELVLDVAMRQALDRQEFMLHYQPQLSVDGRKVIGVEALLRWRHEELGAISPAEFIPLAEANGQIIPIGTWVLRTAVQQLRAWLDAGLPPMVIAVNLSAVQFRHPNLPSLVTQILEEAQLAPEHLELELTEGVTMGNPHTAIGVMSDLHARGVRMSIDDFGTGYSSLSYLKKFPVYKLKIDQSFVRDIAIDADDRAIVTAIVQMGHGLGCTVIAEGVETPAQQEFLIQQGCDEVQGYRFSKPLPADQVEAFIRNKLAASST